LSLVCRLFNFSIHFNSFIDASYRSKIHVWHSTSINLVQYLSISLNVFRYRSISWNVFQSILLYRVFGGGVCISWLTE
jgi:hypothetical protein